ncbi:MAG TPA: hypothetical protein VGO00_26535 [Kofleriaceae bacterium]|jgi:hypothetical protein|nr:hypothetical protein [Kofleriaceae bacterium]
MNKLVIGMVLVVSSLAFADSLEEKRIKADAEKLLQFDVSKMNKSCKATVPDTGVIDWSTWRDVKDPAGGSTKVHSQCGYVAYAMDLTCANGNDKIAQDTIAKDVKRLVCMGDAGADLRLELLKDGTLVIHTSFAVKETVNKTKGWLAKNLP